MLLLASTSDLLRVVSGSALNLDVHASYVDVNTSTTAVTPGRTNTLITTATTTTVVGSPASSTVRTVKTLTIRNRDASSSNDVTVVHSDGTNVPELVKATLLAGDALHYDENNGFTVRDNFGRLKRRDDTIVAAASPAFTTVILAADVTNNNGTANTIADVTGLSFAVSANHTYWFRFYIMYTSAATTTGSRWAINGPASPTALRYKSEYSLSTTTRTINEGVSAYDTPAASAASSAATTSNIAWIEGFIVNGTTAGTVIARFASEVSASAIVAKAGSICHWQQVL